MTLTPERRAQIRKILEEARELFPPDYGRYCNDPACTDRECTRKRLIAKESE